MQSQEQHQTLPNEKHQWQEQRKQYVSSGNIKMT
jgi:hypothetical protein